MKMSCYNCAYGQHRYDRNGLIVGVECTRDNMRYLPDMHIKLFGGCEKWSEVDE